MQQTYDFREEPYVEVMLGKGKVIEASDEVPPFRETPWEGQMDINDAPLALPGAIAVGRP